MREYGKVTSVMWADERLNETARHLLIYLHSGPHTNWIGCFRCAEGYASDDLGLSMPRVRKAFAELVESGWIKRCGKMVFLPGFLVLNPVECSDASTTCIKEFLSLPVGERKSWVAAEILRYIRHFSDEQKAEINKCVSRANINSEQESNLLDGKCSSSSEGDGNG